MGFQIKEGNQGNVVIQSDGPGDHVRLVSTVATPSAALGLIVTGTATMAGTLSTNSLVTQSAVTFMGPILAIGTVAQLGNGITYVGTLSGGAETALSLTYTGATPATELVGLRLIWNVPVGSSGRVTPFAIGKESSQPVGNNIGSYTGIHQDTIQFQGVVASQWFAYNASAPSFSGTGPPAIWGYQVDSVASLAARGAEIVFGSTPTSGVWSIYGNTPFQNALGGPLSINTIAPPAANSLTLAGHLQSLGPVINATNGAASAQINQAIGNDLAGYVSFRTTAAGGAQIIHVFSTGFPTNPYPILNGAGNPTFQASFPTVAVSTNSMTVSLALTPVVGASVAYYYLLVG